MVCHTNSAVAENELKCKKSSLEGMPTRFLLGEDNAISKTNNLRIFTLKSETWEN